FDVANQRRQVGALGILGSADVIANVSLLEKIENVRPAIHAAGFERTFLLGGIRKRTVKKRNVVQVEIAPEIQARLYELSQPAAHTAAARQRHRQPAQYPHRFERRMFGIVNKV